MGEKSNNMKPTQIRLTSWHMHKIALTPMADGAEQSDQKIRFFLRPKTSCTCSGDQFKDKRQK